MADAFAPELPSWVRKRNGELEPFDADKISSALFSASEALQEGNAFLARELTHSILYFLSQETTATVATSAQLAEFIVKIVRELGHPRLAQAFADENAARARREAAADRGADRTIDIQLPSTAAPEEALASCLSEYSLQAVYGRDLAAAHRDGLIRLSSLQHPAKLAGRVCELWPHESEPAGMPAFISSCWGTLSRLTESTGTFLAMDQIESILARLRATAAQVGESLEYLKQALQAARLSAVVNVNCPRPLAGTAEAATLFAEAQVAPSCDVHAMRDVLSAVLSNGTPSGALHVHWHLDAHDFEDSACRRLALLARRALVDPCFTFVFDRPRRPLQLGGGIDRRHPALLLAVGLDLAALQCEAAPELIGKLGTLAQMAVSAAMQRRKFLRRHNAALGREFLLDRARLAVLPIGLEATIHRLTGERLSVSPAALDAARQIISTLASELRKEGTAANLDICLESPRSALPFLLDLATTAPAGEFADGEYPDPKKQLRASAALHAAGGPGTAVVLLAADPLPSSDDTVQLLHFAWQRTDLQGLRFVPNG